MIVRATVDHIRPIYDMMAAYFAEAVEKKGYRLQGEEEKAVIYLGNLLWSDRGMNFITQGHEGFVLGWLGETWFGPNPVAESAVLYVKPQHRNGLIARALLRRFEREAHERNALYICWDFQSGLTDPFILDGLIKSLKYEYQGPIYRKTIAR